MKTPTTIYPSTDLPTRTWRDMRLVFRRWEDDAARLFSRLWKGPPEGIYNNTTAVRSELGHDAVLRYYWGPQQMPRKSVHQDWTGNTEGVPGARRYRVIAG